MYIFWMTTVTQQEELQQAASPEQRFQLSLAETPSWLIAYQKMQIAGCTMTIGAG